MQDFGLPFEMCVHGSNLGRGTFNRYRDLSRRVLANPAYSPSWRRQHSLAVRLNARFLQRQPLFSRKLSQYISLVDQINAHDGESHPKGLNRAQHLT